LSPGTVCGIWQKLVPLLSPLYLAILEATRQSGQWLMDETRWEDVCQRGGQGVPPVVSVGGGQFD
jgi:hypothetical protein